MQQTQCPSCHSNFTITSDHLQAAGGKVRCGQCLTIFQADRHILPEQNSKHVPDHRYADKNAHHTSRANAYIRPELTERSYNSNSPDSPEDAAIKQPDQARHPDPLMNDLLVWLPLSSLLLLALLAQYMWVNFSTLALQKNWQPAYQAMCYLFDCQLPQQTATAIQVTELKVSAPQTAGTSRTRTLKATLTNKGHVRSMLPGLFISFSDINNTVLASGYYQPEQYLPYPQTEISPGKRINIHLTFLDPGVAALNYHLSVLQ